MAGITKMLFGGGGPKPDKTLEALQQKQMADEKTRQGDLAAEEAASKRALSTGRIGRGLLAYTPKASGGKSASLGG